jgi:DNA sulfur modification protein DndD
LILDQITLSNFGIYKGDHTVHLKPTPGKPIILFGAYNGSGKTTLLEGIQLALYGKAAKTSGRGKLSYDEYLGNLINRYVPRRTGAGLSLIFRSINNSKEEKIEIKRTWFELNDSIKETCEVLRNDEPDPISSERWHEFIEEFIPSQISELFFFDGEKIEGLADPSQSSAILKTGIYSLLGINAIDNLIKSLQQVEKKRTIELANKEDKTALNKDQDYIENLVKNKKIISEKIVKLVTYELDSVCRKIKELEKELQNSGADLFENRHEIKQKLLELNTEKQLLSREMIEISSGLAPISLVMPLLSALKEQVKQSNGHSKKTFSFLSKELDNLLIEIKKSNLTSESVNTISTITQKRLENISKLTQGILIEIEESEIPDLMELNEIKKSTKEIIQKFKDNQFKIDQLSKSLDAVPDEGKLKDLILSLKKQQDELIRVQSKIELLRSQENEIEYRLEIETSKINKKLKEIAERDNQEDISKRILKNSEKSRHTLQKFKEALIKKYINSIEIGISECFEQLLRKANTKHHFTVDKATFKLSVKLDNEEFIPATSLSAGERQILAVSILWALAKASGKILPTVIDTPLARLDGPHRTKFVENYFPHASKQVLIFSTDEEVNGRHYENLKPFISEEYKISYDEINKTSSFEKGYFEQEVI